MMNHFYMAVKSALIFGLLVITISLTGQTTKSAAWIEEFNQDKLYVSILDKYHKNAGADYGDGFYNSRNDIYTSLINLKNTAGQLKDIELIHQHISNSGHVLEIISFTGTKNNTSYIAISGFRNSNGIYNREFDFVRKRDKGDKGELKKIDIARSDWVKYSNQKEPQKLVELVYTKNSLYYNNGRLSRGRDAITERYSYMNQPNWSITLTPEKTVLVNNKRAFEIGTYMSSGKGDYVLIWERGSDGKWQVFLDFNF